MKLSISAVSKSLFLAVATLFLFTSCEKDNVDVVKEEIVEPFNSTMIVTFRGVTT